MRLVLGGLFFLLTILLIVFGVRLLFGSGASEELEEVVQPQDDAVPSTLQILEKEGVVYEASLYGVSGYQVNGIANIEISFADFSATMAASLPPIDGTVERYEAWMIQPGIADYFSLGSFFPRADGWYGLAYKESMARVPENPHTYTRILITRESMNADGIPSNVRVAEGFFNL